MFFEDFKYKLYRIFKNTINTANLLFKVCYCLLMSPVFKSTQTFFSFERHFGSLTHFFARLMTQRSSFLFVKRASNKAQGQKCFEIIESFNSFEFLVAGVYFLYQLLVVKNFIIEKFIFAKFS